MDYRRDIDGLRALAIAPVVAFHYAIPGFAGGYVGVDIFFVISGFLIGGIILREVAEGKFSYANFYTRRARRILPALLTVLAVTGITAALILSPRELQQFGKVAAATVFGLSNIAIWSDTGYFAAAAELNPLLMTWSLAVEEQFYVVVPLALLLLHRMGDRAVAIGLGVTCAASLALSWWWTKSYPTIAFFGLPTRAWELGAGVLLALAERHGWRRDVPRYVQQWTACSGLALLVLAIWKLDKATPFPGLAALLPVAGSLLLIASPASWINRRLLGSTLFVGIGLISYSWYLWHWPVVSFASVVKGYELARTESLVLLALSLVLGALSWRFVEQPMRRSSTAQAVVLKRYAILMVAATAVTVHAWKSGGWPGRFEPELQMVEGQLQENRTSCLAGYGSATPNWSRECFPSNARPKVAVLGDSHASALAPGLRAWATKSGRDLAYITKASCPPLLGVSRRMNRYPQHFEECRTFQDEAFERVGSDQLIDTVVLAGNWMGSLSTTGTSPEDTTTKSVEVGKLQRDLLQRSLRETITWLQERGKHVVLVVDVPRLSREPGLIALGARIPLRHALRQWRNYSPPSTAPGTTDYLPDETRDIVRAAANINDRITLWDPYLNFCDAARCKFMEGDTLYYADVQHLTAAGALRVVANKALLLQSRWK